MIILDTLDNKLLDNFRGYVVKKDLVRTIKIGANVPVFVLEYLIANKDRPVSRIMIFDHVWESDKVNTHNTVDVHIKNLRDKIDKPFDTQMIVTAHGIGYMLDSSL